MTRKTTLIVLVLLTAGLGACQTTKSHETTKPHEAAKAATLRLAALFSNDMVLQRDVEAPVWGWAKPRVAVRVTRDKEAPIETTADHDGKWMVRLAPMPAGGPHELTIAACGETITLSNVMMGDVWICSGQSNMQWPVYAEVGNDVFYVQNFLAETTMAKYPDIRLYIVPMVTSFDPQPDILPAENPMYPKSPVDTMRTWRVCSPETVPPFSAVAYFFGRAVHRDERVPVGLIQTAWGGTLCEAWTSAETLRKLPDFAQSVGQIKEKAEHIDQAQQEYKAAVAAWRKAVDVKDHGFANGEAAWAAPSLNDADWPTMELPNLWETQGYPNLDGYAWFRREVTVPEAWAGKDLELHFAAINDANQTWFNGVQISDFDDQAGAITPRNYVVPGRLVKAGANVIAVRVYDMGNNGGFVRGYGEMELRLAKSKDAPLPLTGLWKMRVGAELKDLPARPQEPMAKGNPNVPTVLYNAMINPLIPFGIKGAIWYQGESNAERAYQYRSLFPAMITDWREKWGQGDFPFFFVQLANFMARKNQPVDDSWAELREAQCKALSLPKTGMAVTIDLGDVKDIHPKNKQDVGERLALAARQVAYGENLVYSGPTYKSMSVEGSKVRLHFDNIGGGLVAQGASPVGFAIAGADKKFVWADARLDKDTVVVSAPEVKKPVAVRYAWAINPFCNLYNAEGLPASPFRTDDWPGITVQNH